MNELSNLIAEDETLDISEFGANFHDSHEGAPLLVYEDELSISNQTNTGHEEYPYVTVGVVAFSVGLVLGTGFMLYKKGFCGKVYNSIPCFVSEHPVSLAIQESKEVLINPEDIDSSIIPNESIN